MHRPVLTGDAPGPTAGAPYNQAVIAGDLVFVSGQLPIDVATGEVVPGEVAEQTEQVLRNLAHVLRAAGSDLAHVVRTTVYLRSRDDWPAMNDVYATVFTANPPARTAVEVGRMSFGALVEIDAIAMIA